MNLGLSLIAQSSKHVKNMNTLYKRATLFSSSFITAGTIGHFSKLSFSSNFITSLLLSTIQAGLLLGLRSSENKDPQSHKKDDRDKPTTSTPKGKEDEKKTSSYYRL